MEVTATSAANAVVNESCMILVFFPVFVSLCLSVILEGLSYLSFFQCAITL